MLHVLLGLCLVSADPALPRNEAHPVVTVRVLDSQGAPVAGAIVRLDDGASRATAITGDDGRFQSHQAALPALLLIEKSGFRFTGKRIEPGAESIEVRLTRLDERPGRSLGMLPPELPQAERASLVKRLLGPLLEDEDVVEGYRIRAYERLAAVDPPGALRRLEESRLEGTAASAVRMRAAQQLLKSDAEEALLVGETVDQPLWRTKVYLDACNALPNSERPRKLELLGQALVYARGTEAPAFRAIGLGFIGERLLDLGEIEKATEVLREGEEIARQLPTAAFGGYARGAFAEELAQIDLEAALALTKDLQDEREYDRHHGNIAHELAAKRPDDTERVLNMVREQSERSRIAPRDQYRVRVCYRMITADPERARAIADQAHDAYQRAYAYGTMAHAVAESKPDLATELLRKALDILQARVESDEDTFNYLYNASIVGAALLPAAERIDAALVPEFFWRAVSLRMLPEEGAEPDGAQLPQQANATLAMLLAFYDREVATVIRDSVRLPLRTGENGLRALALIDPRKAIETVQEFEGERNPIDQYRLVVAEMLALEGEERWREAIDRTGLWIPDTEDHGF